MGRGAAGSQVRSATVRQSAAEVRQTVLASATIKRYPEYPEYIEYLEYPEYPEHLEYPEHPEHPEYLCLPQ